MYDALTSTYAFACPHGRKARVPLSSFRALERLPGAAHPAVYRILFACRCGEEHPGLVAHDELDWAPLGATAGGTFRNLLTAHDDLLAGELSDLAAMRIGAGVAVELLLLPRGAAAARHAVILRADRARRRPSGRRRALPRLRRRVRQPRDARAPGRPVRERRPRRGRVACVSGGCATGSGGIRAELRSARFDERRLDLEL